MRFARASTIGSEQLGADWTPPGAAGSCTRRQMKSGVEEGEGLETKPRSCLPSSAIHQSSNR